MEGKKYDSSKEDWSLLDLSLLTDVVKVLHFGANKYDRDNWKKVSNAQNRYYAAILRHLRDYQSGEKLDKESNLPHLAHLICNALFLLHFDKNETSSNTKAMGNMPNIRSKKSRHRLARLLSKLRVI